MFTTVPDKSAGDVFTEAMWDTYIRDNFNKGVCRPIAETVLGSAAGSITFGSIATDWTSLLLLFQARGDTSAASTSVTARLNNDSGANYYYQSTFGQGSSTSSAEAIASTGLLLGEIAAATATAGASGIVAMYLPNYTGTTFHKSIRSEAAHRTANTTGSVVVRMISGHWANTAAVNTITILPGAGNFIAGSKATLYGLGGT